MTLSMKITIISHNLSSNALGRAYILAKALKQNYEIEFIGLVTDKGIWPPCNTGEFTYIAIKKSNYLKNFFEIYKNITGDVIYVIKPLPSSFGIGLAKKIFGKKPLVLDIDDWELGFAIQEYNEKKLPFFKYLRIYLSLSLLEKLIPLANRLTTVSIFLNTKFGSRGVFVPHGRDVDKFNPKFFDTEKSKEKLGLKNHKVVMFLGSVKPHKGLDNLLAAVRNLEVKDLKLVLIGVGKRDEWLKKIIHENKDFLVTLGFIKFDEIPEYLAAADIVVLPQQKNPGSLGQIPAKMFDAMSMEKPIVSTKVSDIPKILDGCGIVVRSGNTKELANAIDFLLKNPERAKLLGKRGREKCIKEYNLQVMEKRLQRVFDSYGKS